MKKAAVVVSPDDSQAHIEWPAPQRHNLRELEQRYLSTLREAPAFSRLFGYAAGQGAQRAVINAFREAAEQMTGSHDFNARQYGPAEEGYPVLNDAPGDKDIYAEAEEKLRSLLTPDPEARGRKG